MAMILTIIFGSFGIIESLCRYWRLHRKLYTLNLGVLGLLDFLLSLVYAKCTRTERLELWEDLIRHSNNTLPWLVGGYFNTILSLSEKKGGLKSRFFAACMIFMTV